MTPDSITLEGTEQAARETAEDVRETADDLASRASSFREEVAAWFENAAPTETRVADQTQPEVNEQFMRRLEANVFYYARHLDQIPRRLSELDKEWDVERVVEASWASASLLGIVLGLTSRRMGWLPALAGGFMLQHVVQGWCPPVPAVRRMGVRTTREINIERCALKALRGDFKDINPEGDAYDRAAQALAAVMRDCPQRSD